MVQKRKTIEEKIIQEALGSSNLEIQQVDKGRDGSKFIVKTSEGDELFCRIRKQEGEPILPYQEEEVLSQVDSPHIVKPIVSDVIKNRYILIRPCIKGQDLEEVLKEKHKLPADEIKKLAKVLFETAKSLAEVNAVHFDIKPANIIISEDGEYKLVDFGAAKFLSKMRNEKLYPGRSYIAPEVLRYLFNQTDPNLQDISTLSDLYSIGGVLYTLATGKNLSDFFKSSSDLLQHTPPPVRFYEPNFDNTLSDIIDKLISKEPARRPHPNDLVLLLQGKSLQIKKFPLYFLKTKPKGEHKDILPVLINLQKSTGIYWTSDNQPNFNPKVPIYNVLWETSPKTDVKTLESDLILQHEYGVIGFCVSGLELDTPYNSVALKKNIEQVDTAISWKSKMALDTPLFAVIPISEALLKSEDIKHVQNSYKSKSVDGIIVKICVSANKFPLDENHLVSIANFIKPWKEAGKIILFDGDLSVLPLTLSKYGVTGFISSTYPKTQIIKKRQTKVPFARKPDGMYVHNLLAIIPTDSVTSLRGNPTGKAITNCSCPACATNLMKKNRLAKWERPERRQHFVYTVPKEIDLIKKSSPEQFKERILAANRNGRGFSKLIKMDQSHLKTWFGFLEKTK